MNLKSHESFSFLLRLRDRKNVLKKGQMMCRPVIGSKQFVRGSAGRGFACRSLGDSIWPLGWSIAYQRELGNAFGAHRVDARIIFIAMKGHIQFGVSACTGGYGNGRNWN